MNQNTQRYNDVIEQYYAGLLSSIESNGGLVGEFFGESEEPLKTRLLCQTRSVYFLLRYAKLKTNIDAISSAVSLYQLARKNYFVDEAWRAFPDSIAEELGLYGYASLSYSECYLYLATKDEEIANNAKHSLDHLSELIMASDFFPAKCMHAGQVSQNPIMHLFESFVVGFDTFKKEQYRQVALKLFNLVTKHFYSPSVGLVGEVSQEEGRVWFEPGHAFEWVSLLHMAKQAGVFQTNTESAQVVPRELLRAAEELCVQETSLVPAKFYADSEELEHSFRIWPQLERIRAHFLSGNTNKVEMAMASVNTYFFTEDALPREYVEQVVERDKVKTTTGYHIVNGIIDQYLST